jgi:hypothetical protein
MTIVDGFPDAVKCDGGRGEMVPASTPIFEIFKLNQQPLTGSSLSMGQRGIWSDDFLRLREFFLGS